jgi:hypothetical protein
MLVQKAVYWAPSVLPDKYGRRGYETPVEIDVRWEDVAQEFVNDEGVTLLSHSVVYTSVDIEVEGVLLQGTLVGVITDAPFDNGGAYHIRKFDKLPFLRKTNRFLRTAFL